ncbi:hypothetical protein 1 [Beihai picorna-like virus 117]|uniref:hypothetical protein 1 n=1 Tax=Beihai picorna-like virus 117 TaxID=1922546 RepID=UPI000909D05B|nr:hypothetical protein 1 [Beihai picorna-like virus 117]APG76769.1 hypothetical protein 1 [Beihai picorna-like virus 117]APG76819.1 hypothetical protein 1 [Beihai picorna-like virus 117]
MSVQTQNCTPTVMGQNGEHLQLKPSFSFAAKPLTHCELRMQLWSYLTTPTEEVLTSLVENGIIPCHYNTSPCPHCVRQLRRERLHQMNNLVLHYVREVRHITCPPRYHPSSDKTLGYKQQPILVVPQRENQNGQTPPPIPTRESPEPIGVDTTFRVLDEVMSKVKPTALIMALRSVVCATNHTTRYAAVIAMLETYGIMPGLLDYDAFITALSPFLTIMSDKFPETRNFIGGISADLLVREAQAGKRKPYAKRFQQRQRHPSSSSDDEQTFDEKVKALALEKAKHKAVNLRAQQIAKRPNLNKTILTQVEVHQEPTSVADIVLFDKSDAPSTPPTINVDDGLTPINDDDFDLINLASPPLVASPTASTCTQNTGTSYTASSAGHTPSAALHKPVLSPIANEPVKPIQSESLISAIRNKIGGDTGVLATTLTVILCSLCGLGSLVTRKCEGLADRLCEMGKLCSAQKSIFDFFSRAKEMVQSVLAKIIGPEYVYPELYSRQKQHKEIHEVILKAEQLSKDSYENVQTISRDPQVPQRLVDYLYEAEKTVVHDMGPLKKQKDIVDNFHHLLTRIVDSRRSLEERMTEVTRSISFRQNPASLYLYGDSGIGKSKIMATVRDHLSKLHGHIITNFPRNSSDEFWEDYVYQDCTSFDDFLTNKKGLDVEEVIKSYSSEHYPIPMGTLSKKGRLFMSKYLLLSANTIDADNNEFINNTEAVYRRRDLLIGVTFKEGITQHPATDTGTFDHLEFTMYTPIPDTTNEKTYHSIGIIKSPADIATLLYRRQVHYANEFENKIKISAHIASTISHNECKEFLRTSQAEDTVKINFLIGPPGCGKTLLANKAGFTTDRYIQGSTLTSGNVVDDIVKSTQDLKIVMETLRKEADKGVHNTFVINETTYTKYLAKLKAEDIQLVTSFERRCIFYRFIYKRNFITRYTAQDIQAGNKTYDELVGIKVDGVPTLHAAVLSSLIKKVKEKAVRETIAEAIEFGDYSADITVTLPTTIEHFMQGKIMEGISPNNVKIHGMSIAEGLTILRSLPKVHVTGNSISQFFHYINGLNVPWNLTKTMKIKLQNLTILVVNVQNCLYAAPISAVTYTVHNGIVFQQKNGQTKPIPEMLQSITLKIYDQHQKARQSSPLVKDNRPPTLPADSEGETLLEHIKRMFSYVSYAGVAIKLILSISGSVCASMAFSDELSWLEVRKRFERRKQKQSPPTDDEDEDPNDDVQVTTYRQKFNKPITKGRTFDVVPSDAPTAWHNMPDEVDYDAVLDFQAFTPSRIGQHLEHRNITVEPYRESQTFDAYQYRPILNTIAGNICTVSLTVNNTNLTVRGIITHSRRVVTVSHLFNRIIDDPTDDFNVEVVTNKGTYTATLDEYDRSRDLAFLNMEEKSPQFRDIRKHITHRHPRSLSLSSSEGVVFIKDENLGHNSFLLPSISCTRICTVTVDGQTSTQLETLAVSTSMMTRTYATIGGDCGSPLIFKINGEYKIVGLHATSNGYTGTAAMVSIDDFNTNQVHVKQIPHDCVEFERTGKKFANLPIVGKTTKPVPVLMQGKTKLHKTALWNEELFPCTNEPAILSPFDERCKSGLDPMIRGLKKYERKGQVDDALKESFDEMSSYYANLFKKHGMRVKKLSDRETINGICDNDGSHNVNRTSAAGFPSSLVHPSNKGKMQYIQFNEQYQNWELKKDEKGTWMKKRIAQVDAVLRDTKTDAVPTVIFTASLKDETRPIEKIHDEKTRVFTAAPTEFVLNQRRYLNAITSNICALHGEQPVKVGMNAASVQFHYMQTKLIANGKHHVADADFSNWDGGYNSEIHNLLGNHFYAPLYQKCNPQWDEGDLTAIKKIYGVLAEPLILARGRIVKLPSGQLSGQANTAVDNSLVNLAIIYTAWKEMCSSTFGKSFKNFTKHMGVNILGDDIQFSATTQVKEIFSLEQYAQIASRYGFTATSATDKKKTPQWTTLQHTQFLKRTAIQQGDGYIVGRLDKASIYKQLKFTRLTSYNYTPDRMPVKQEYLFQKITMTALREAVLHGRKFFRKFEQNLQKQFALFRFEYPNTANYDDVFRAVFFDEMSKGQLQRLVQSGAGVGYKMAMLLRHHKVPSDIDNSVQVEWLSLKLNASVAEIHHAIETDKKGRFQGIMNGDELVGVRPANGCSTGEQIYMSKYTPHATQQLYHITDAKHTESILKKGLMPNGHRDVHLMELQNPPSKFHSLAKRQTTPVYYTIKPEITQTLYRSYNGYVMSPIVIPPKFLTGPHKLSDIENFECTNPIRFIPIKDQFAYITHQH